MRTVILIGVGAGDPDFITQQAVKALNRVDVFFLVDKGESKDELISIRREICQRFIVGNDYRFVSIDEPPRDRGAAAYEGAVADWLDLRAGLFERAIIEELDEDGTGAFLVWGDPTLYDGTIRIIDKLIARGEVTFEYEVIPGISAIQVLVARHRLPLNRIGEPIHITTGRRLAEGIPAGFDNIVVMLDAGFAAAELADADRIDVYWGAYLGTDSEVLISGRLSAVAAEIAERKSALRAAKGWIMDTYLLRRV
ncbi:precorrin-6A synthase (deacetylating) [Jatrophihabitans sp. DSM 45814]